MHTHSFHQYRLATDMPYLNFHYNDGLVSRPAVTAALSDINSKPLYVSEVAWSPHYKHLHLREFISSLFFSYVRTKLGMLLLNKK